MSPRAHIWRAHIGRVGIVLVAASLAATSASAKDEARRVVLDPAQGRAGVSVLASGAFSPKPEDVKVLVAGKDVMVFELAEDRLRFIVPADAKLGPLEVEFVVRGHRSRAIYRVLDKKDERTDGPAPAAGPSLPLIRDVKLEVEGGKAIVTALTDLPADFSVAVVFGSVSGERADKERVLGSTKTRAKAGKLRVELGPFAGEPLGRYFATLTFELSRQSALSQKGYRGEPSAWARAFTVVGSDEALAQHVRDVSEHYATLVKRTGELRALVEKAADPKDKRFLRGGFFDADAWLRFVEEDVWKPLRLLHEGAQAFEKRWLGPRDERADVDARARVRDIVTLVQHHSKEKHAKNKLEVPEAIREPRGLPLN